MSRTIIAEGKTTNEAIDNGLKILKVSKDKVDVKVLESEGKRSFFSILSPRVVKVELTLKENVKESEINKKEKNTNNNVNTNINKKEDIRVDEKEILIAINNINNFLSDFSKELKIEYTVENKSEFVAVQIDGEEAFKLIGYRGETLNSLQTIINSIASRGCESRIRVILNVGDYKEKREKALEGLADKLARNVIKTGKSVTLEPMMAYERKIIHNKLQTNKAIKTYSIGEEPYRKVVISKNK